jgi:hypothetical protein
MLEYTHSPKRVSDIIENKWYNKVCYKSKLLKIKSIITMRRHSKYLIFNSLKSHLWKGYHNSFYIEKKKHKTPFYFKWKNKIGKSFPFK